MYIKPGANDDKVYSHKGVWKKFKFYAKHSGTHGSNETEFGVLEIVYL